MRIDLGHEPVPGETTVCKFRHLLERHGLGQKIRRSSVALASIYRPRTSSSVRARSWTPRWSPRRGWAARVRLASGSAAHRCID